MRLNISPRNTVPSRMLSKGLRKHPRLAASIWPLLTAHTYSNQFDDISAALTSIQRSVPQLEIARQNSDNCCRNAMMAINRGTAQTTRWAIISIAGTVSNCLKKTGKNPQHK